MLKKLLVLAASALVFSACQASLTSPTSPTLSLPENQEPTATPTPTPDTNQLLNQQENQKMIATLKTSLGEIKVELFSDKSPKTVANFIGLADGTKEWSDPKTGEKQTGKPLYAGTIFHRVIKGFMIQGGDPLGSGFGGPGYKFEDETTNGLVFDKEGYLAMANSGPNTNGSQFFITTVPTPWLNGKHTIFGRVVSGMDIVKKIESVDTDANDKPATPIILESVGIGQE